MSSIIDPVRTDPPSAASRARYRSAPPQLGGDLFLTDGGLETTLIYHHGIELPDFASFVLLDSPQGLAALERYYRSYLEIAVRDGVGLVLETPTWRANRDWGAHLGYEPAALRELNRRSVQQLEQLRAEYENDRTRVVISGCIGPRGDGYDPALRMGADEAERYHAFQAEIFADSAADSIGAITMNYVEEAIGVARAARAVDMPVVISFTVETDGRLPTGQSLASAIEQVDIEADGAPAYYMINCAHPSHFAAQLDPGSDWVERIRGIRANASTMSHAELDVAEELDDGDPQELGGQYAELKRRLGSLNVVGGCCGTDHRHIDAMSRALAAL